MDSKLAYKIVNINEEKNIINIDVNDFLRIYKIF